jgi:tetratricopeptide (TPR) repeat protein
VEVSPELVEVAGGRSPRTRWQQPFDASLTDVFQVQGDIAARVAGALHVALGDSVQKQLAAKPTSSLPAYDAYLRGRSYEQRARLNVEPQAMTVARQMYEQAIAHDSSFGLAWARLSLVHLYLSRREPTDKSHIAAAKAAAQRALTLMPGSAEAHLAMGRYLRVAENDLSRAMGEFNLALQGDPNNSELLITIAYNQWGRGRRDSAEANIRHAYGSDPRSPETALALARVLAVNGRFGPADTAYDKALALAPDQYHSWFEKAQLQLLWRGDVAAARAVMKEAEARIGRVEFVRKMCVACFEWTGPLAPEYEHVLDQLSLDGFAPIDSVSYYEARGWRAYMNHQSDRQRVYFDSARVVGERLVKVDGDNSEYRWVLGEVYAALGRMADAAREQAACDRLTRASGDTATLRGDVAFQWARLLVLMGKPDAALDSLRVVLADTTYHYATAAALRVDPFWIPFKSNPRFDALVAGH